MSYDNLREAGVLRSQLLSTLFFDESGKRSEYPVFEARIFDVVTLICQVFIEKLDVDHA